MTIKSRLISFFPALMIIGIFCFAIKFASDPSFFTICYLLGFIYLFPPMAYRIHNHYFPLSPGISDLIDSNYSAWWGGHQIQLIFVAFPQLEALLRILPGFYSSWLKLWGSKIGKNVYWTPSVLIEDRGLMRIGDDVIFGHFFRCACHVIKPKEDKLILFVKEIEIGSKSFIGAGSTLGPGAEVKPGEFLPVQSIRSVGIKE